MMSTIEQRAVWYVGLVLVVIHVNVSQVLGTATPGRFADLKPVPGLDLPEFDWSPALTEDELTIVFSRWSGGQGFDLYEATRATVDDPFGEPVRPNINGATPWISKDGRSLYFAGGNRIYSSTRESLHQDWQPRVRVLYGDFDVVSPSLSDDELTMYFTSAVSSR